MKQSMTAPFEITTPQRVLDVDQAKRPRSTYSTRPPASTHPPTSARSAQAVPRDGSTKAERSVAVSQTHRRLHLAVLAGAMRVQRFSERSIDRAQRHVAHMLDVFQAQGVQVPAPKVFDPAAPSLRARVSLGAPDRSAAREIERTPCQPIVFSR
jgi:hypothetical protein